MQLVGKIVQVRTGYEFYRSVPNMKLAECGLLSVPADYVDPYGPLGNLTLKIVRRRFASNSNEDSVAVWELTGRFSRVSARRYFQTPLSLCWTSLRRCTLCPWPFTQTSMCWNGVETALKPR